MLHMCTQSFAMTSPIRMLWNHLRIGNDDAMMTSIVNREPYQMCRLRTLPGIRRSLWLSRPKQRVSELRWCKRCWKPCHRRRRRISLLRFRTRPGNHAEPVMLSAAISVIGCTLNLIWFCRFIHHFLSFGKIQPIPRDTTPTPSYHPMLQRPTR